MSNLSQKQILVSIVITIASLGVLFGAWKLISTPKQVVKVEIPVGDKDHLKGAKNAKVTLIEFSDFQCPACGVYFPIVKQISDQKKDNLALVYKHFPLPAHQNAKAAAFASEAAGGQGKFWEMHDKLFSNQEEWSDEPSPEKFFEKYAKELKLDVEKFKKDSTSPLVKEKVENDSNLGTKVNVNATPTFFLNGVKIDPVPRSVGEFLKLIDEEERSKSDAK